ncbi:hypothetical protein GCM10017083_07710 [Thalassobaculum fulvum]|uniref:FAD-binding PCMH-type domain-containing protein n=1 Tax=Thalassobaculum fulvum TaxID=1633335 RepID=A0A918XP50_9PROT|nr:4-hydroxy-2-oxoheptanedioate aldolase [Thalassobaculum fulvum]GHD42555.1 hypothetical protein GCM10017083_07710 [Thalassobaculum fulvum]
MRTPDNGFKQALARGETRIGLWLALADAYAAELCAGSGFDWLLIDGEHAPNDLRSILAALQAVAPYPVHPVVRLPHGDPALIKQVLDLGAATLLVPMVETAEQAHTLARAMRYPPAGTRGVGSGVARSSRWTRFPGYLREADDRVCLLVQVESETGLAQLEAIAAVDGVDGVFIGPADLAASMGHLGRPDAPEVRSAIDAAIAAILKAGKAPGILATDPVLARHYLQLGARFVAVGVDTTLLARSTAALAASFVAPPADKPSLEDLRAAFSGRLLTGEDEMEPFLVDWRRRWRGRALAVAQPDTTLDVAAVLSWCNRNRVPVVPQGGNTGLSGGSVPDGSGRAIVLSLTRLSRIRAVDPVNNTITVEAGCTLQQVQEAARAAGRLFPLSLAAEGTCTIGGNLATNAGGVRVLRYGNARELCLGLEAVTPSGEVWDGLRGLRKDNTGYDLRDLYIGSEGTLGVITAAVLKLHPLPAVETAAFIAVPDLEAAVRVLELGQQRLNAELTAFELLSEECLGLVLKHMPALRRPLAEPSPWYVLIGVSSSRAEGQASQSLMDLLEAALERGWVTDATAAQSLGQVKDLWALRENTSEAQAHEGPTIKHDISLPISAIPEFAIGTGEAIASGYPGVRLAVLGHLGDGNLHYNLLPAADRCGPEHAEAFRALEAPINRLVHDAVARFGGSVSAEHGLGVLRRAEAARYKSPVELRLMRTVKDALDPLGLMNPGKLFA